MKHKNHFLKISLLFLAVISVSSCKIKKEETEKEEALAALQFVSAMSSFPNKDVPANAYGKAYDFYIQHFKNSSAKNSSNPLPWNNIGPNNNGGRTISIAIDPVDTSIIWLGSASGGLWKSTVGGVGPNAWQVVETGFPLLGVGAIAINPQNHNELFIGTGETYSYGTAVNGLIIRTTRGSHGIGILKSVDGGLTWNYSLNWLYQQQRGVWKIVYNKQNSKTLLAATTDGIYKSIDAGANWIQTDTTKMAMDLVMDPSDTNIVYAGVGNLSSAGNGIYRSSDAGSSWTKITSGLPTTKSGRTALSIDPSNPFIVYANIADDLLSVGFYKSIDKGLNWVLLTNQDVSSYQGWYAKGIHIDPTNSANILVCGVYLWQSTDGGFNFNQVTTYDPTDLENEPWPDMHDIISNPLAPQKIYLLTDAGLYRSNNNGQNWKSCFDGYTVAQFYTGSVSASNPSIALAGAQDHGTQRYKGTTAWDWVLGGDGTCNGIDKTNDLFQYASYQNLNLQASFDGGFTFQTSLAPNNGAFASPFEIAPSNQDVMYAGSDALWRSDDKGLNWNTYGPYGNDKVLCIGISETNPQKVYFAAAPSATAPMKFFKSTDGGATVTDISAGLPNRYPRDIAVSATNDNEVYAVFSGFGSGHVFYSSTAGQTWTDISASLPDVPFHSILSYSGVNSVVFAGSDLGVFYSYDTGVTWLHAGNGVPDALQVFDLEYSPSDQNLVAFTHGRGAYKTPIAPFITSIKKNAQASHEIEIKYNSIIKQLVVHSDKIENAEIQIFDLKGALLYSAQTTFRNDLIIDATNWNNAVYLVRYVSASLNKSKRIIKC